MARIKGNARGNTLQGTDKADIIDGGGVPMKNGAPTYEASDIITGKGGDDTITLIGFGSADGGSGDDTFNVTGDVRIEGGAGNDRVFGQSLGFAGEYDYLVVGFGQATKGIVANFTAVARAGVAGGSNAKGFSITDGQGGTDKVSGIHAVDDTKFDDVFYIDGSVENSYDGEIDINLSGGDDYVEVIGTGFIKIDYGRAQGGVSLDWETDTATDFNLGDDFIGFDRVVGVVELTRGSNFADSIACADNDENIRGNGGSDKIWGRGGDDKIWGDHRQPQKGDGSDTINGGAGNDWLMGGGGKDAFVFDTKLSAKTNVDTIDDFSHVDDTIALSNDAAVFAGLTEGRLAASAFKTIASATSTTGVDKDDRILFDKGHGDLYFDRDGSGAKYARVKFAEVADKTLVDHTDFLVI